MLDVEDVRVVLLGAGREAKGEAGRGAQVLDRAWQDFMDGAA
ncbi:MAG: hypothetical protein ACK559_14565 [bacterium]